MKRDTDEAEEDGHEDDEADIDIGWWKLVCDEANRAVAIWLMRIAFGWMETGKKILEKGFRWEKKLCLTDKNTLNEMAELEGCRLSAYGRLIFLRLDKIKIYTWHG